MLWRLPWWGRRRLWEPDAASQGKKTDPQTQASRDRRGTLAPNRHLEDLGQEDSASRQSQTESLSLSRPQLGAREKEHFLRNSNHGPEKAS